jgi:Ca2+-binding EF-hand superfamily protein
VVDFGFVASPQTLVRNDPLGVTNLFTRIDGEEKYIEEKDIAGPQYQALRTVFDAADRNNDGRLTRSEYEAFFRLQSSFQDLPLGFNHSIQTPGLFNLIDTSQDGRLGVRELRKAWERLKDLEPDTSDSISRAAIKPHGQIMFGRASQVVFVQPRSVLNPPAIPTQTRGPIWYRKMDRNGDGDISRREFLGAKELFDRMDANHDDMISFEEAEAFDSTTRKKE